MLRWTKLIIVAGLLGLASAAAAYCTTHTIYSPGKIMFCTTCCYGGFCTTTCF
jgi:hypothetical protein